MTVVRKKGVQIAIPIVYGSTSVPINHKRDNAPETHTHRWTVFMRGVNGEDISYFVKRVSFRLHESFTPQVRSADRLPFEVVETGWGEFEIMIKVYVQDGTEKAITLFHHLQLYPKDDTTLSTRKTVHIEYYDEIVFNEPTEEMYDILLANQKLAVSRRPVGQNFSQQTEDNDLRRIMRAIETVQTEAQIMKNEVIKAEAELRELQSDIRALESAG
ncbi:phosphogluconate dehydrogenase (NADP+-dependent, decarboxylating) [Synchytrium endobioticum]|uniref:Protein AF-9 homolog n=1 Tax=Synchytrium endobioticum TaxID=286115 RepID=A0A507CUF3_9FUNG|nr:phosphogluconate dehydrogenase (NADP+-dependent, decarboxylating) [Synchytrium endobioticum]